MVNETFSDDCFSGTVPLIGSSFHFPSIPSSSISSYWNGALYGGRSGSTAEIVVMVFSSDKHILTVSTANFGTLSFSSINWMIRVPVLVCGGWAVGQGREEWKLFEKCNNNNNNKCLIWTFLQRTARKSICLIRRKQGEVFFNWWSEINNKNGTN